MTTIRIGRGTRALPVRASVIMVTVAVRGDLLGQNRFRTIRQQHQLAPSWQGRDRPRWWLMRAGAPDDRRPYGRGGRAGRDRGQLVCPRRGCGDTLQRWGYGRSRHVRSLGAEVIDVRAPTGALPQTRNHPCAPAGGATATPGRYHRGDRHCTRPQSRRYRASEDRRCAEPLTVDRAPLATARP